VKKFKRPQLSLTELKVPRALNDLYLDLRDRRLLPLIGLILVAIVATPFLLGGGVKSAEPVPAPIEGATNEEASLTVMPAEPGLREPRKRLAGLPAKNPFRQHYTAPVFNKGAAPTTESSTSSSTTSTVSGTVSAGGSVEAGSSSPAPAAPSTPQQSSGGSGNSGGKTTEGEVPDGGTFYTLEVTVQVTRIETKPDGTSDKKGPTTYKDVLAPAPLPGEKTPVITYLGMGSKHHEPLFLVSDEVSAIFGEAKCISGTGSCQLLVLEEGFPVTFVYGDNDVRYKVNLVKAAPAVTDPEHKGV
jgi:hypothetical protein